MVQHADNCSNFNIIDALLDKNLFHLVEDIFVRLDSQSLTNAENSSNHWSQFIQLSGRLYRKKMATISSWLFIKPEPEVAVLNRKSASLPMALTLTLQTLFFSVKSQRPPFIHIVFTEKKQQQQEEKVYSWFIEW